MELDDLAVSAESPFSADAVSLMKELSECLAALTGDGGNSSFDPGDVCRERALFAVARDGSGKAAGCGAFRPMDETTAEIKRMYARKKGAGGRILAYLERRAAEIGYTALRLETRAVNTKAVSFYERNGYEKIPNYGRYENRAECVCFEKRLPRQ